jgi:hypothetical protein
MKLFSLSAANNRLTRSIGAIGYWIKAKDRAAFAPLTAYTVARPKMAGPTALAAIKDVPVL